MIDEEIKIIINDILCHTREMLKFLRSIKTGKYNAYLDDLIDYTICNEEDIQAMANAIDDEIETVYSNIGDPDDQGNDM